MTIYITHTFPHFFYYICDGCETKIVAAEKAMTAEGE
jgi:hypothetical protein